MYYSKKLFTAVKIQNVFKPETRDTQRQTHNATYKPYKSFRLLASDTRMLDVAANTLLLY